MGKSHFKEDIRDIWKVDIGTIGWEFWSVSNQLGKFSMKPIISGQWWRSHQSLACKVLCILRFCVMSWKDEREPNIKYCLGTAVGLVQRFIKNTEFGTHWRRTDVIRVEYFPGFTTLQLVREVQELLSRLSVQPEYFTGRIIFMSMFNDISWWSKDNEKEGIADSTLVSFFAKRFPAAHWSFFELGSETKWYSTYNERPQGEWVRVAELMMIKFGESGHPVFRATSALSRGTLKSKGGGKLSIHFCADGNTIETVFRPIISVNQFSIYGAVSDLCEEYRTCQTSTVRPVLAEQSDHCSRQQTCWWWHLDLRLRFLHKKIYCRSTGNEWKGFHNQIDW